MIRALERRASRMPALVAASMLLVGRGLAEEASETPPTPVILALAESSCGSVDDVLALQRRLESLGPAAIPDLFRIFDLTRRPIDDRAGRQDRSADAEPSKVRAVFEAMAALPRRDVLHHLDIVAHEGARTRTLDSALIVLGRVGREEDAVLALRLARRSAAGATRSARLALRTCLEGILERERFDRRILTDVYVRAPDELRATIARTAAGLEPREARETLVGLLQRAPAVDALILSELARLGPASNVDRETAARVRACLRRPDATVQALAAIVCGRFGDDEAVGELILLLRHADAGVRVNAHEAVKSIARLGFRADPGTWEAWYAGERAWWEGDARATLSALPTLPAAEAAEEIQRLARRRLYRREIADALADCLDRDAPDVVRLTCATLGDFGFPESMPALARCLDYPEIKVREAARKALLRINRVSP